MAVEITKEAVKRFTMECDKCETQFQYSLSDCTRRGYSYFIECPFCKVELSHFNRIREIPKFDIQQDKIEMLRDFAEYLKRQFPNNAEQYFGYQFKEAISKKYSELLKEIKNESDSKIR
jgi:hypothetical protein